MISWLKNWWANFWGLARIDPAVVECASEEAALAKAQSDRGPAEQVLRVAATGSMAPLIPLHGAFVLARAQAFATARLGTVALYNAAWYKGAPVAHRLVSRDSYGFIASGDNNAHSEPRERITAANYLGEVSTVYRWPVAAT